MKTGIHPGLGMKEYHAWQLDKVKLIDGPVSCSTLKRFAPNPFAWLRSPEITQTAAMRKGSILDAALTDPDELDGLLPERPADPGEMVVAPFDSFRSKAAREFKTEHEAQGKVVVTQEQFDRANEVIIEQHEKREIVRSEALKSAQAVREHKVAGEILDGCEFQVGVIGKIGEIPAKCLIDIYPAEESDWGETLVDYKTTGNGINDASIRKTIGQFKLHWQAAFYRSMHNAVSKTRHIENFAFIFQDVTTNEVRVVVLSDDALALGNRCVGHALKKFATCAYKGIHSDYAKSSDALDLMPYHSMDEDEWLISQEGGEE